MKQLKTAQADMERAEADPRRRSEGSCLRSRRQTGCGDLSDAVDPLGEMTPVERQAAYDQAGLQVIYDHKFHELGWEAVAWVMAPLRQHRSRPLRLPDGRRM